MQIVEKAALWLPRSVFGGMHDAYFILGLWVLLGLLFGALTANRAVMIRRSPAAWFVAGFLTLFAAYLYLRLTTGSLSENRHMTKLPVTRDPAACSSCAKLNHPSARICLACGARLEPIVESEVGGQGETG